MIISLFGNKKTGNLNIFVVKMTILKRDFIKKCKMDAVIKSVFSTAFLEKNVFKRRV